jgi:hypothetical protein
MHQAPPRTTRSEYRSAARIFGTRTPLLQRYLPDRTFDFEKRALMGGTRVAVKRRFSGG